MLLSATMERVETLGQSAETPGFCFGDVFHPHGFEQQVDFAVSNRPPTGMARFVYAWGDLCLTKSVYMARGLDEVTISYRLETTRPMPVSLTISPFTAMRDFHGLTRAFEGGFPFAEVEGQVVLGGRNGCPRLWLRAEMAEGVAGMSCSNRTRTGGMGSTIARRPIAARIVARTCSRLVVSRRAAPGRSR